MSAMGKEKTFKVGDFVFAKVRGFPPWPARVQSVNDPRPASLKYTVFFFGTSETAVVPAKDIHIFVENKERLGKPLKRKYFNESIKEVEEELAKIAEGEISTKGLSGGSNVKRDEPEKIRKPRKSVREENSAPNTPESSAKKTENKKVELDKDTQPERKKRRIASVEENVDEDEDSSKDDLKHYCEKHMPKAAGSKNNKEDEANSQSQDKVSRSGRVIKKKRFIDDSVPEVEQPDQPENKEHEEAAVRKSKPANEPKEAFDLESLQLPLLSPLGRVMWAKAKCGQLVQVKIDHDRPSFVGNAISQAEWEKLYQQNLKKIKQKIETSDAVPKDVLLQLTPSPEQMNRMTETELRECKKVRLVERKKGTLRWLKLESRLIDLDVMLRTSLKRDEVDAGKALTHIEEMLSLPVDALILKKHPQLVETMKRIQQYTGDVPNLKMSENEKEEFNRLAYKIRQKAKVMLSKFRSVFAVTKPDEFWDVFVDSVNEFKRLTKDMKPHFVQSLTMDPTSPHFADYSLYNKEEEEFSFALFQRDIFEDQATP